METSLNLTMKITPHFLLAALCLLLFNSSIFAQSYTGINFRVDKAHSPLFVADNDTYSFENTTTLAGLSLFAEFEVNDLFSIVPELTYSRRVAHYIRPDSIYDNQQKSISSYLQIPILLKTTFHVQSYQFFLIGGPHFELAVKMENYKTGGVLDGLKNNLIKRHDIGFSIGTGVEKMIARKVKTVLQLRYAHGFRDLDSKENSQFYNKGFSLLIGLSTPVKI